MRGFFAALEQGHLVVRLADSTPPLAPEEHTALRGAGVLRDEGREGIEEVSVPDLARALRALYGIQGRGLSVPSSLGRGAHLLGWLGQGDAEREVRLLGGPALSIEMALLGSRRALFLVPTARTVTPELRAKHGAEAYVAIDVLEESLTVHDGHLARAGGVVGPSRGVAPHPGRRALEPDPHLARRPCDGPRRPPGRLGPPDALRPRHGARTHPYAAPHMGAARRALRGLRHLPQPPLRQRGRHEEARQPSGGDLCAVFGLPDTPFHPYRPTEGWQTRFRASPRLPREL